MKNNLKNNRLLIIGSVFVLALVAFFAYKSFAKSGDIKIIQTVAAEYFEKNKSYGVVAQEADLKDCFARGIFVENKRIMDIFADISVTDISCKFKVENNLITAWSVSLIKGEKVYCGDSVGNNEVTPGITTTSNCKAE